MAAKDYGLFDCTEEHNIESRRNAWLGPISEKRLFKSVPVGRKGLAVNAPSLTPDEASSSCKMR
jgi:hypothetical protein